MAPRAFARAAIAAALFLSPAAGHLFNCPTYETVWTTPEGKEYGICDNTDYKNGGSSLEVIECVNSTQNCVRLCDAHPKCEKAVYDKKTRFCHIKDNSKLDDMDWADDDRFDVIHRDYQSGLPDGSALTSCPSTGAGYRTRGGVSFSVCSKTDYTGPSSQTIPNTPSPHACADLCAGNKACDKAVYDTVEKTCHIKDKKGTLKWVVNARFISFQTGANSTAATLGQWSDIIDLPVIPVAAYIVPSYPEPDRMLFFSSWGKTAFGGASGKTQYGDYNFVTGAISEREVADTRHDMFCPGISQLADGRVFITGGSDADVVSIYDPATNKFTRGPNMKVPRGYQTSTILSDGRVFTIGGAYSGSREAKNGEVYDPATEQWTYLPDADAQVMRTSDHEGVWREDNHGWLFGWKNASVFQAGPSMDQHWYGTEGTGSVLKAGTRDTTDDAMCGIWAMYDATRGKIFSAGGSPEYTNSDATTRAHITTIGEAWEPSTVERVADMGAPRGFANAVVLPDGTILVTGGQRRSIVFTNTAAVLEAELFNPATKEWTQLAAQAVPRNYHSVSILMPDGTVFSGGGGLCYVSTIGGSTKNCDTSVDHPNGEIFSPPYLFNADGSKATRPVVSNLAQDSVRAGDSLNFTVTGKAESFAIIRMGTVTHSVNSDQRRIPLENFENKDGKVTVQLPSDSGILLPGYYYLFAMSPQGTPSVAKSVHVEL
ncbi:galactose oxidase [Plectosphaerella plurivora]|uniref:Galactose oxidase n=1 Tax=Plectosphaerella plurivora TaxID=936078 RepID=A0A9P8V1B8_9PEZI|nr:galactose oxidase [Plectosphaerella plurivora]